MSSCFPSMISLKERMVSFRYVSVQVAVCLCGGSGVRAAARLHAAVDTGGGKSLGGAHAAGNLIQHSDLPRFP